MRKFILLILIAFAAIQANSQDFEFKAFLDQTVSCKGNNDGSIQAMCSPEGDYKYVISRGKFNDSNPSGFFKGLEPGVYKVSATRDGKTFKSTKVTVTEPKALKLKFTIEKYPATLDELAIAAVEVTGGTTELQPYLITWYASDGSTLNRDDQPYMNWTDNIRAGTYSIKIEDDHGCFLTKTVKIPIRKK